jgi:hypothetical protein
MSKFDKNSLWNRLNVIKEGVVCHEEKFTRYAGLSQTVMGIPASIGRPHAAHHERINRRY